MAEEKKPSVWDAIKGTLLGLLSSKKAWAAVVAAIVWLAGRFGLSLPAEELYAVIGAILTYVLGQGLADAGKEKAKIQAAALGNSQPPQ